MSAYPPSSRTPGLGLVLGGGGMKGMAHLGALSVIEEAGLYPDRVGGTSIGALIGALYASGRPVAELTHLLSGQRPWALLSLRLDGQGLLDVDELRDFLVAELGDRRIEDLSLPFLAVATDLETGRAVILDRGPVVDAVLASTAVPGLFAPVEIDGRRLVDGGLRANLPVKQLRDRGAEHTIAVRLFGSLDDWSTEEPERPDLRTLIEENGRSAFALWAERIRERYLDSDRYVPRAFEYAQRALDVMIKQLEDMHLERNPPDVLIQPELAHVAILDFGEKREAVYERGVLAARARWTDLGNLARRVGSDKQA